MDNETPNYASWIPAAGGYVANGKVVSKSPLYDEAGKLRIDVDTSVFGNTQTPAATQPQRLASQEETTKQNLQNIINAQSPETQKLLNESVFGGMSAANQAGSGKDANSLTTGVGSLGSLNNNTENTEYGPTNTPATHSNIAGEPILTPVQQAEQELQKAIASGNDFPRMINAYTRLQNLTGVDYSAEIKNVMKQGQQSVENVDNDYSNRIATAMMRGDTEEVERLRNEQAIWRNTVGYQDVITQKYQTAREDLNVDYETTYMEGVKDITGMLMQALPGILNFQYNPYTDPALQVAQGYAVSRVKEQMNATGMYYSSMTQNAITKAVAELVPVYQKMAKEEAIQNFQLLQQTANFLVNLEETQFNLWKGQLDMKFKANAEKRAEIEAAWDKVNQLGYVDNETSAILGIPAGTESYQTRKMYVDKLNQIDAEERNLQQNKALERYQTDLAMEKMERQSNLDLQEYREKTNIGLQEYEIKSNIDLQEYGEKSNIDLQKYAEQQRIANYYDKDFYNYQLQHPKTTSSGGGSGAKYTYVIDEDGNIKTTITTDSPMDIAGVNGNNQIADKKISSELNQAREDGSLSSYLRVLSNLKNQPGSKEQALDYDTTIKGVLNEAVYKEIDGAADSFSKDYSTTKKAIGDAENTIDQFAQAVDKTGLDEKYKQLYVLQAYARLFDNIDIAGEFDYSWWNFADNKDELKQDAKKDIIKRLGKDGETEYIRTWVAPALERYSKGEPLEIVMTEYASSSELGGGGRSFADKGGD